MTDEVKDYEILNAEDITSDEFYVEWLKAVRRELSKASDRGLEPEEWVKFVRYEVNSCLDNFFPIIKSGNVGIKYSHPVVSEYESGPEYDETKADGVSITIVFDFEKNIDVPKD
jgi:hypothetical protein